MTSLVFGLRGVEPIRHGLCMDWVGVGTGFIGVGGWGLEVGKWVGVAGGGELGFPHGVR